jgi:hypothetical protein
VELTVAVEVRDKVDVAVTVAVKVVLTVDVTVLGDLT